MSNQSNLIVEENRIKEEKEANNKLYRNIFEGINNYLERLDIILDPPTRSLLFLNTMLLVTDNIMPWVESLTTHSKSHYLTSENIDYGKKILDKLKKEFGNLMNVAQYAMYSPDHPIGKKILDKLSNKYTKTMPKS